MSLFPSVCFAAVFSAVAASAFGWPEGGLATAFAVTQEADEGAGMMSVLPITLVLSTCLLAFFVILFIREQSKPGRRGIDHESLLPLEDETPRVVAKDGRKPAKPPDGQGRG